MNYDSPRSMRLLYLAGPGDVIGTYRHWRAGEDDPSQVALTYSGQFFSFCRDHGISAKVIAYHPRRERLVDGEFDIEHRPVPLSTRRGPLFHLGWYWFALSVALTALWQRCDALVLMAGTHLTPYWIPRRLGRCIILSEQCVLWPKHLGPRGLWKAIHYFDRSVFRRGCDAIVTASKDIETQIEELTGKDHSPFVPFLPSYRRDSFGGLSLPDHRTRPFRVLFAGRIERNKGVFDLVRITQHLLQRGRNDIRLDIAGDGGALDELRATVNQASLEQIIHVHGHCRQPQMRRLLGDSHAVIVPTRSDFIEGFNQVVAEAVLAHRPFITSDVCPALEYAREAGIEVPADDTKAYADAICLLADDDSIYDALVSRSHRLAEQFYDPNRGWAASLGRALSITSNDLELQQASITTRDLHSTVHVLGDYPQPRPNVVTS